MAEYPKVTVEEFKAGVGNTPLVKIESISNEIGRNVYFKAEYTNSGKSIKDRAVLYLLEDALKSGRLQPGGTIAEATAGNTGIALALIARSYDPPFKVVLFLPESIVQEKIDILEELGAEVVLGPLVAQDHPEYVNNLAIKYAQEHENTVHLNQMDSLNNRRAHYENTGPEIWAQTGGEIDGFIVGAGTGGTFGGVSSFLKSKSGGKVKTYLADREGSGLYSYISTEGESWVTEGESFVEGVGKTALTGQLHDALDLADGAIRIRDPEVINTIYRLKKEDGLEVGASGGMNIAGAKRLALSLPEGSTVVTTVADTAERYKSKLFNRQWLQEKGHWEFIDDDLKHFAS